MDWTADRSAGLARLAAFAPHAGRTYAANRNFDDGVPEKGARDNVSQLSPWLHAGLLSEREVIAAALAEHSHKDCDQFVAEVFWRVYFKGYLEQRPSIWRAYVAERDAALAALDTEPQRAEAYARATRGRTGIAAFDHCPFGGSICKGITVAPSTTTTAQVWMCNRNEAELRRCNSTSVV